MLGKAIAQGIQWAVARQIAKRVGKQLDKVGNALEKAWKDGQEQRTGRRQLKPAKVREVGDTPVKSKRRLAEDAAREDLVPMLISLGFDPQLSEDAVTHVLADVSLGEKIDIQMLATPCIREAKALKKSVAFRERDAVYESLNAAIDEMEAGKDETVGDVTADEGNDAAEAATKTKRAL